MNRVHWINVDGTERIEENVESPTFNAMKDFLGDNAEHVTVLYANRRCSMFVHEFGRIQGLPRNEKATEIYFAASRSRGIDPMAEFEAFGSTIPEGEEGSEGVMKDTPFGRARVINLDPRPNEPLGIHGPAILLVGFE